MEQDWTTVGLRKGTRERLEAYFREKYGKGTWEKWFSKFLEEAGGEKHEVSAEQH